MKQRCDNCRYWYLLTHQIERHPDDLVGCCHRHAPVAWNGDFQYEVMKHLTHLSWSVVSEEEKNTEFKYWEEASEGLVSWPKTWAHQWCGEYERKRKSG